MADSLLPASPARRATRPLEPLGMPRVLAHISRCAVCDLPNVVVAVHSQSAELPACPAGWASLWSGYSFLMVPSSLVSCYTFLKYIYTYYIYSTYCIYIYI